ncbi:MAG: GNAT family N-acetyltransferase [Candidatus Competibacteraceae bacterium]|nr:GNAT family N-acetyltransferase [Candidatus Competibacteraceae bacterium]
MSTRLARSLFEPDSIALIGASERPGSLGTVLTRNVLAGGFKGDLFLVNRRHRCVQGVSAFRHLSELPRTPELAILATPASTLPALLAELGRRGTGVAVVVSAADSGKTNRATDPYPALLAAAKPHGLRVLGPDSLGLMAPRVGLDASLGHCFPPPGHLALVAQSGMVLTPVLEWMAGRGIGVSSMVALGAGIDVGFAELLDGLADDPDTQAILLCLEALPVGVAGTGVEGARSFLSAARAAARVKPVLVVRAGRGGDAASHQLDAIYDAAFRRTGMSRVRSLRELCWIAETLALDPPVNGDRLAIVGNSRELGLLAADTLLAEGGRLARFSATTEAAWRPIAPVGATLGNPLDLGRDAGHSRFAAALDNLLDTPEIDGVLVLHAPSALVPADDVATAVVEAIDRYRAGGGQGPGVLACCLGGDSAHAARQRLLAARIPAYDTPNDAIRAFMRCWRHQRNRIALMETPPDRPDRCDVDPSAARQLLRRALAEGREILAAEETSALLTMYGILSQTAASGSTAQPIALVPPDLAVRVVVDPVFGPVLLLGLGGGAAALSDDIVAALPPLDPILARAALAHTRIQRWLQDADAGQDGLLDGVVLLLVKVARLIVDLAEIVELALNPIALTATGVTVGTARVRVATATEPAHDRLAIRPYPRQLEETLSLPDGSTLWIRPVRPEDEPGFIAGFAQLSREEVRMRFMHVVKALTHADAARLTRIDYDREMALVALRQRVGQAPGLCGVARFAHGFERARAEFAIVLLRDATGIGLGSLLLRRLIDHARRQGIRELFGEILRDNEPMLKLCRAMGFTVRVCPEDPGVMIATLPLAGA